ncbi:hypothetical protein BKA82DRAFT_4015680 [Pisolithus tinctorius]|nr:hypothetical protein BKA82DRAFT_4015680 [Pisolithus tinctorius]
MFLQSLEKVLDFLSRWSNEWKVHYLVDDCLSVLSWKDPGDYGDDANRGSLVNRQWPTNRCTLNGPKLVFGIRFMQNGMKFGVIVIPFMAVAIASSSGVRRYAREWVKL